MSQEQLGFDFTPPMPEEVDIYEALDIQLAALMQELNGKTSQALQDCTLKVSKHTREGQIAIACPEVQQTELLKTKVVGQAGAYKPLILDNGYLYLRRYWQYQQKLADQLRLRLGQLQQNSEQIEWQKERLAYYFGNDTEEGETNWQQLAAEQALKHKFLVLSGGPGTGKTTTITRILALLIEQSLKSIKSGGGVNSDSSYKILLAAPTGKAAVRMLDAIREAQQKMNLSEEMRDLMPSQASTIHKLLGYQVDSVQFKHNSQNPLKADVVLVDEASMIDIALMEKLVEAVPSHAKLILIGDKDQLASVETGSVFADICQGLNESDNLVSLQKNWRFSHDSGIGQLASAANKGDSQKLFSVLRDTTKPECALISPATISGRQLPGNLIAPWENYFRLLNGSDANLAEIFSAFNHYRVLCALRQGLNGSTILSERIETALEKQGFIKRGKSTNKSWYHGRPVMITQNSYSKELFNGDTGICLERNGEIKVYFPAAKEGQFKSLAPVRLPAHETTWAMTIHKSQGSEFDQILLVLPHEEMPLLTRQLIYTGITRARKKVFIVASEDVLNAGIKTEVVQATQIWKNLR